jgi:hypothetical protein
MSEATREDQALATDVEETSKAEVHETSVQNGLGDKENAMNGSHEASASREPEGSTAEFARSAAAARESLIAELQRTVETVSTAVDDATARSFEEAQAEARRQAEAASARVDALEREGLVKLRALADELLERSTWLSEQLAELTNRAASTASAIREEDGPSKLISKPPPQHEEPATRESPRAAAKAEAAAAAGDSDTDPGSGFSFGRFRRRKGGPEVPEGVRLIISQMRVAGEPDSEIVRHLEEMGVKDPHALISQVKS